MRTLERLMAAPNVHSEKKSFASPKIKYSGQEKQQRAWECGRSRILRKLENEQRDLRAAAEVGGQVSTVATKALTRLVAQKKIKVGHGPHTDRDLARAALPVMRRKIHEVMFEPTPNYDPHAHRQKVREAASAKQPAAEKRAIMAVRAMGDMDVKRLAPAEVQAVLRDRRIDLGLAEKQAKKTLKDAKGKDERKSAAAALNDVLNARRELEKNVKRKEKRAKPLNPADVAKICLAVLTGSGSIFALAIRGFVLGSVTPQQLEAQVRCAADDARVLASEATMNTATGIEKIVEFLHRWASAQRALENAKSVRAQAALEEMLRQEPQHHDSLVFVENIIRVQMGATEDVVKSATEKHTHLLYVNKNVGVEQAIDLHLAFNRKAALIDRLSTAELCSASAAPATATPQPAAPAAAARGAPVCTNTVGASAAASARAPDKMTAQEAARAQGPRPVVKDRASGQAAAASAVARNLTGTRASDQGAQPPSPEEQRASMAPAAADAAAIPDDDSTSASSGPRFEEGATYRTYITSAVEDYADLLADHDLTIEYPDVADPITEKYSTMRAALSRPFPSDKHGIFQQGGLYTTVVEFRNLLIRRADVRPPSSRLAVMDAGVRATTVAVVRTEMRLCYYILRAVVRSLSLLVIGLFYRQLVRSGSMGKYQAILAALATMWASWNTKLNRWAVQFYLAYAAVTSYSKYIECVLKVDPESSVSITRQILGNPNTMKWSQAGATNLGLLYSSTWMPDEAFSEPLSIETHLNVNMGYMLEAGSVPIGASEQRRALIANRSPRINMDPGSDEAVQSVHMQAILDSLAQSDFRRGVADTSTDTQLIGRVRRYLYRTVDSWWQSVVNDAVTNVLWGLGRH